MFFFSVYAEIKSAYNFKKVLCKHLSQEFLFLIINLVFLNNCKYFLKHENYFSVLCILVAKTTKF